MSVSVPAQLVHPEAGRRELAAGAREPHGELLPVTVFFLFTSLINMVMCLSFLFFTPAHVAFPLCTVAYATVAAAELYAGVRSPVTLSLLALYLGLALLTALVPEVRPYAPYTGAFVFGWLALLLTALLIAGRPFTTFYARARGMPALQRAISYVWIAADVGALLASLYFMPDVLFLYVPLALCLTAGLATIVLNLIWFGARNARQREFAIGPIKVRELEHGSADFDRFCSFFCSQSAVDHGRNQTGEELQEWCDTMKLSEARLRKQSIVIGAFEGDKLVGSVRCMLDRRGHAWPMEEELRTSLDGLRRRGRLLYVGRVAVETAYRQRPDVMSALFKGILENALENDVSFIVVTAFTNRVVTFMKLGFEALFARSDPRAVYREPIMFDVPVVPLVLNLARLIISGDYQKRAHQHFAELLNPYLGERWYKRLVIRHLWQPAGQRPWECDLAAVRAAAISAGAPRPRA